ncbi:polysaccharide deacetylase [Psychromonas sp. PRT-SC03]|nr:polysaccharide deacetylase [Psychromonas sp. PRT-SC03]
MNILMALSQLEVTGAEVYATTIGNNLSARGHNLFYVSDNLNKEHKGQFFKLRFNKRSIIHRFFHVFFLIFLIKKNKIQLIQAHSRASAWSCHFAAIFCNIPLIVTVHGRQPSHRSSKIFNAMGDLTICVCKEIQTQIFRDLGVDISKIHVLPNGIALDDFNIVKAPQNKKKIISIIGRLSGPKGDVCYELLTNCIDLDKYHVRIISGTTPSARFNEFKGRVEFTGYSNNVQLLIAQSDLVIGSGRVAIESILSGRPTFAIGEANAIGILTIDNIEQAMASNFGDINAHEKGVNIDFSKLKGEIENALESAYCATDITQIVTENYDLNRIVNELEKYYQDCYITKKQKEIPIIMYHRFIEKDSEKGVHGTYLNIKMLEKHFKLLKRLNFETLTFSDIQEKGFIHRLQVGKRFIMITADDGYKDNLELMLPLLEKYRFKATIYAVSAESFNRWDVECDNNPEKRVALMTPNELKKLNQSPYIEIGGHTLTHPQLQKLNYAEQYHQIAENKKQLETLLDQKLISFAYPYGLHDQNSKDIVKKLGYNFAVATNSGPLCMHKDSYQLRRIAIFPGTDCFALWRKIRGNYMFKKVK